MESVADPLKIMGRIYDALNILPQKKSLKHVEVSVESLQRLSRSEYGYPIDTARVIMKIITVIASWENENTELKHVRTLNSIRKSLEQIYFHFLVRNSMFLEFSAVGKVVSCILRSATTIPKDEFTGAVSFELPLHKCYCAYTNILSSRSEPCRCSFSPSKYRINISSLRVLTELQRFWCCIYAKLSANKMVQVPVLLHQESCRTLIQMAESMSHTQCTTLTFVTLCKAIHSMIKFNELIDESHGAILMDCLLNWFAAPMHGLSLQLEATHRSCTTLSVRRILAEIAESGNSKVRVSVINESSSRISMEGAVQEAHILISDILVRQFTRTTANHEQMIECMYRSTELLLCTVIPIRESLRVHCLKNFFRLCRDNTYVDNSLEGVVSVYVNSTLKLFLISQHQTSSRSSPCKVAMQRLMQLCCDFSTIDILCTYAQKSLLLSHSPSMLLQARPTAISNKTSELVGTKGDSSRKRKRKRSKYAIVDDEESDAPLGHEEEEQGGLKMEVASAIPGPTEAEDIGYDLEDILSYAVAHGKEGEIPTDHFPDLDHLMKMLLAYEAVVTWQCKSGSVDSAMASSVTESYCGLFSPFIKNGCYRSAREKCVPLYMNIIFLQSVYRSIRIVSFPMAAKCIPLSVQQLLFESLQISLPYIVSLLSRGDGDGAEGEQQESCQSRDLNKFFTEVFAVKVLDERTISVSSNQENCLCFTWLYLASLPIAASGESGGITSSEFSFLRYLFWSPKLREHLTVKFREYCLFVAAKFTLLDDSNCEGITSDVVSSLADLIELHDDDLTRQSSKSEQLCSASNSSKFSPFLLQVVDSILSAILLGMKNTYKADIAALELMSSGYFFSHCMNWSSTSTWVDVFHNPVLCSFQIYMLQLLQNWKTEHIHIGDNTNVKKIARKEDFWDLDFLPLLTMVTSHVSTYLTSLEKDIAADVMNANDGDSMDEGNSSSESIDAKMDSSFSSTEDSPSRPTASSKITCSLAAIVDHCLLLLAVTRVTMSRENSSEPLSTSTRSEVNLKNLILRLLSLLAKFPSKISKELHVLESRLSEAICLVLHFLPLEKDSSVSFNAATPTKSEPLGDFLDQLLKLTLVPFSVGRIECKIAVSGMARFVRSTAILAPKHAVWFVAKILATLMRFSHDPQTVFMIQEEILMLEEEGILMYVLNSDVHLAVDFILLPLIDSHVNGMWEIFHRCMKTRSGCTAGVGVSDGSCSSFDDYLKSVGDMLVAKVLLNNEYKLADKQKLFTVLKGKTIGINIPTNIFCNERSMLFYHILLQVCSDEPAELKRLMSSDLDRIIRILYHAQDALETLKSLTRIDYVIAAFHNVQLQLIWDLGSEDKDSTLRCRANRALQIVTVIGEKYSLRVDLGSVDSVDKTLENYVAENLPKHFLFIMRNLLAKHDWATESTHYQVNCIRSLRSIISCLKVSDLCKFLPKIMTVIHTALDSSSFRVRYATLELVEELARLLPKSAMRESLSTIVICLFPLIEQANGSEGATSAAAVVVEGSGALHDGGDSDRAMHSDLCDWSAIPHLVRKYPHVAYYPKVNIDATEERKYSNSFRVAAEAYYSRELSHQCARDTRSRAIAVIKYLFHDRNADTREYFCTIAYIPKVDELQEAFAMHQQELRSSSLETLATLLCGMLRHESEQVKLAALKRISYLCRDSAAHMQTKHRQQQLQNFSNAFDSPSVLTILLQELLRLCSRKSSQQIHIACAKCLGFLGAIDPGRIRIQIHTILKSHELSKGKQSLNGHTSESKKFPPWGISFEDFGLYLLEYHLVPGLGSSGSRDQDRSGYAIQKILRLLAENRSSSSKSAATAGAGDDPEQPMPQWLRGKLTDLNIEQITEPFWLTNYDISEQPHSFSGSSGTIFHLGIPCSLWLQWWIRRLIGHSKGPMKALFNACRGVARFRTELCQVLLPYLILDIATNSQGSGSGIDANLVSTLGADDDEIDSRDDIVFKEITEEIYAVLVSSSMSVTDSIMSGNKPAPSRPQSKHSNELSVQSVFGLLDTFQAWETVGKPLAQLKTGTITIPPLSTTATTSSSSSLAPPTTVSYADIAAMVESLHRVTSAVPKRLLGMAAMSVKAFARAIRYIEIDARESHIKDSQAVSAGTGSSDALRWMPSRHARDRANGILPILSFFNLNVMTAAFSRLEDEDSLVGIQALRQIFGHRSTFWSRCLHSEQSGNWVDALLEYGLIMNSRPYMLSIQKCLSYDASSDAGPQSELGTQEYLRQLQIFASDTTQGASVDAQKQEEPLSMSEISDVERGRLRCLIELGQLEAAIEQSKGVIQKLPELEVAVLPLGIEAAWRLLRWDDLDTFLGKVDSLAAEKKSPNIHRLLDFEQVPEVDRFQCSLGRIFINMHKRDDAQFFASLDQARLQASVALAAAGMESYRRAYPLLARLHILHEIENGYQMLKDQVGVPTEGSGSSASNASLLSKLENKYHWQLRLEMTSPSINHLSLMLAVRRNVLGVLSGEDKYDGDGDIHVAEMRKKGTTDWNRLIAENWLCLSQSLRQLGKFDCARLAIRNADRCGLDEHIVTMEECKILRDTGEVGKALTLLEPVEIDLQIIMQNLKATVSGPGTSSTTSSSSGGGGGGRDGGHVSQLVQQLSSDKKRQQLAEKLQFATQMMIESQQRHGKSIINRYKATLLLSRKWEQAHFELAKYYEYLYHEYHNNGAGAAHGVSSTATSTGSAVSSNSEYEQKMHAYDSLQKAIIKYGDSIKLGSKFVLESIPRMLTLWLSFTSLQDPQSTQSGMRGKNLRDCQMQVNEIMQKYAREIPPSIWYVCMPQLVSRVGHRNPETIQIICSLLLRILTSFPQQGLWHIAGLIHSFNADRKKVAKKMLQQCHAAIQPNKPAQAQMLADSQELFTTLINLASFQCKDKKIRWQGFPAIEYSSFLVPTQSILHSCRATSPSSTASSTIATSPEGLPSYYYSSAAATDLMYIRSFHDMVDVASSKAKPKTITITTTCGKLVKFLCKQEKDGDLRKDSRMMEFNAVVNRLLQEAPEGRRRNLRLRTFSVLCLNEECGLLEWVNNTDCIRHVIALAHSYCSDLLPPIIFKDIHQPIVQLQGKYDTDIEELVKGYQDLVLRKYRPALHRWFLEQYPDPTEWVEARSMFTRSAAVWSGVGHVIGLGDRHTENILLDVTNGECVHVDFDCLFDKGLSLARPEIVPFRLTCNMVDAMGPSGVEGTYRRTLEVTMGLLRENKETLLSVLEPFLRDPTVAWSRSGRAQKAIAVGDGGQLGSHSNFSDHENKEANDMLKKIADRLHGVYNLVHPHRERIEAGYRKRSAVAPTRGLGSTIEDTHLPLSVQGQVERLIDEATIDENLAQLYVGWQPWL